MTKSEYIGGPRNAEEMQLSALPLDVLLHYADVIMADPKKLQLVELSWDNEITASWTDDQYAELAWKEEDEGEEFLASVGYEGLIKRHSLALAQVSKAIFAYLQAPDGDVREFVRSRLSGSKYVKETYSKDI